MEFDELFPLTDRLPGLRRLGFSITMDLATNVASSLIVPAIAVTGPQARAIRMYSRLLAWTNRGFARPPYGCVVQTDAEGERRGAPTTLAVRRFHEDGYDLTAIAGESMAEQLLDRSAWPVAASHGPDRRPRAPARGHGGHGCTGRDLAGGR